MMAELSLTCPTVTASGLITLEDHETIDSLVHGLSEDSHTDINRNAQQQVINVSTLTTVTGTDVRSIDITRNVQGQVVQTLETQYDAGGAIIQTLTTTITRDSSGKVIDIDTVEVGP